MRFHLTNLCLPIIIILQLIDYRLQKSARDQSAFHNKYDFFQIVLPVTFAFGLVQSIVNSKTVERRRRKARWD